MVPKVVYFKLLSFCFSFTEIIMSRALSIHHSPLVFEKLFSILVNAIGNSLIFL